MPLLAPLLPRMLEVRPLVCEPEVSAILKIRSATGLSTFHARAATKDTVLKSPQSFLFPPDKANLRDIRGVPVAMLR